MRYFLLLTFFALNLNLFPQGEGQNFCDDFAGEDYFPLNIQKKKIIWGRTYYFEEKGDSVVVDGKDYIEFYQQWEKGKLDTLYLREENGVVFQYVDSCEFETIRLDHSFKKGTTWQAGDEKASYKIKSFKGKLKTPYCSYKDLLVIEAEFSTGIFLFYYKKGYGYIGATVDGKLISFVTPDWLGK